MNKKEETLLHGPLTVHDLHERRALTADAITVAEHEIRKELNRRLKKAQKAIQEAHAALGDVMYAYNEAVLECYQPHLAALQSDINFSYSVMNKLDTGPEPDWHANVDAAAGKMFFAVEDWKENTGLDGRLTPDNIPHVACEDDFYSSDLRVYIHLELCEAESREQQAYCFASRNLELDVSATGALHDARKALAEQSKPYFDLKQEQKELLDQLRDLPNKIKELEMQATTERLKAAGGGSLLLEILDSANLIKEGKEIHGVSLALGLADDTGEESSSNPACEPSQSPSAAQSESDTTGTQSS